jgi:FKBP-type peptidyl-prolyl cis-trans isomerase SlyD
MVGGSATHSHEHEHELAPAQFGVRAQVSVGKYVSFNYTLRTNGTIRHIRSAVWGDEPLEYQHGSGRLLPGLERALEGKVEGERFVVTLPPEDAYGERDKALQQRVPAETFGGVDQIEPGMCFLAHSDDDRRVESVIVTEVDEDNGFVVVDTNHPLAGMALEFEVCVVSVRDTPAAGTSSPNPVLAGMGDGLALAAARATLASQARKPGGAEAPEPPAHNAPATQRNQGTSTKR